MNKKTTILITSIMLSTILLVPGAAFGEIPVGCQTGAGNLRGQVVVTPDAKDNGTVDTFVTYNVFNDHDNDPVSNPGDLDSCDGQINSAGVSVNSDIFTDDVRCDAFVGPITISDGETIQLWGPSGIFGQCEIKSGLIEGVSTIAGVADAVQFNLAGSNDGFAQDVGNTAPKQVFGACIDVVKEGPPKTQLEETAPGSGVFEAIVTYEVTVTNCADGAQPSTLDGCILNDTIAGDSVIVTPVFGTINPLGSTTVAYDVVISGDTTNVATVICQDQDGNDLEDFDDHFVPTYTAGIEVTKSAPPKLPADTPVTYTVVVTNLGSSTVTGCQIDDPSIGLSDTSCTSIAPGGSCTVTLVGPICSEAPPTNEVTAICFDQLQQPVIDTATADAPRCAAFSVDIQKVCDIKVVQVPGTPDPINCTITITNDGPDTITDCTTSDTLTGGTLALASTLDPGASDSVSTSTDVTADMIAAGTVTNTATVTCDTQLGFDPVSDTISVDIDVRSVDATVEKSCSPKEPIQIEPGTINWDWTITNTSLDGLSSLGVICDGFSTINNPEVQDDLITVLASGEMATSMWTESGLAAGDYSNKIICTFTAQNDRTFERMADDTCKVDPPVGENGCTPGYWKANATFKKDPANAWTVEAPDDTLAEATFTPQNHDSSLTLLDALKLKGGEDAEGMEGNLLRHCVAAKLNAENLTVVFGIPDAADVIAQCNEAMATEDRDTMEDLKDILDDFNNAGCNINMKGEPEDSDE